MTRKLHPDTVALLTRERLENDYNELRSFEKIAEKYSVCRPIISKYIHMYGIQYDKSKYMVDVNFFSKNTEHSFYVAGFVAADGCITTNNSSLSLSIQLAEKDISLLENIKIAMSSDHPIHKYQASCSNGKKYPTCKLCITSKELAKSLERFNISKKKSLTYEFPEWLLHHPMVNHFMRGYSDGDGSFYFKIDKRNGSKSMMFRLCGTEPFLKTFLYIVKNNNPQLEHSYYIHKYNSIYLLDINGNKAVSILSNFLYKKGTIMLDRKLSKVKHLITSM